MFAFLKKLFSSNPSVTFWVNANSNLNPTFLTSCLLLKKHELPENIRRILSEND